MLGQEDLEPATLCGNHGCSSAGPSAVGSMPTLRPDTAAASAESGSAETSAAPSRAPVSLQETSAPSWPRLCSKRQPEPRQVRGPDATSAAQRFFSLEGLRPYIILGASPGDGLTAGLPRGFPSEQVASVEESPRGKGAETPILQRRVVYVRRYVVMTSGRRNMG